MYKLACQSVVGSLVRCVILGPNHKGVRSWKFLTAADLDGNGRLILTWWSWTFHMLIYDVVWLNFSRSLSIGLWGNGDQLTLSLARRAEEEIVRDSVILSYQFCVLDLSATVDHVRIILCLVQLLPCLCLIWSELKIRLNYYLNVHFPFT